MKNCLKNAAEHAAFFVDTPEKTEDRMPAQERRERFLILLSVRRKLTVGELCREFGVHRTTVLNDIVVLTPYAVFHTQDGRNGGIIADQSWHFTPPVLTPVMVKALRDILAGEKPDREVIAAILEAFGPGEVKRGLTGPEPQKK